MKGIMDTIMGRRSVREYGKKPVEAEKIDAILEAARWAPSARNVQEIDVVVVKDAAAKKGVYDSTQDQKQVLVAPVSMVLCVNQERIDDSGKHIRDDYKLIDAGIVAQNIMLAARDLGLGSCPIGAFDENKLRKAINCPGHSRPVLIITIGYADETPESSRIPMEERTVTESY